MTRRYLSLISFEEAIDTMKKSAPAPGRAETVLIDRAVGRVLSEPVYARFTVPGTNVASMDGLAVRSAQTRAATDKSPLVLADAARINTGQPAPPLLRRRDHDRGRLGGGWEVADPQTRRALAACQAGRGRHPQG